MERKEGYYWLRLIGVNWEIGWWNGKYFILFETPHDIEYYEDEFEEINENRIIPPNER